MIRAFARALRSLGAFTALVALLGGVPAVLLRIAPLHLPSRWPQWTDLVDVATRPDDGHLFVVALSLTAWAGWAAFALSAVLEAVARLRGAPALRLPGFAAPQRLVAALMTSTAVLVSSAAIIAPAAAAARPPAVTAPAQIAPSLVADVIADSRDVPAADEEPARVTVQRGDTLWDLAERHLGHGSRYPEIAALNYGRPQPDGRRLTDPDVIRPGWILRLPTVADQPAPTPPEPTSPAAPTSAAPTSAAQAPSVPTSAASPTSSVTTPSVTTPADARPAHRTDPDGIHLAGSYLPWSLAGAITAAAAMVWLRRRRRPATDPDPDEFALPDVVETIVRDTSRHLDTRPPADLGDRAAAVPPQQQQPTGGSGLVGPGAASAARAALVAALSSGGPREPDHRAEVVIDGDTLPHLLGPAAASFGDWPRLHIAATPDHALTLVEAQLLHRAHVLDDNGVQDVETLRQQVPDEEALPPILLITQAPRPEHAYRTQAALTLGTATNITGLLLGPWTDGPTLHVTAGGCLAPDPDHDAASGPPAPSADHDRIAVLDTDTAVTLLQTLHEAHTGRRHHPGTSRPGDPDPRRPEAPARDDDPDTPDDAATSAPRARLQVLGTPEILNISADGRSLRSKALELAVFLTCHRDGADTRTIGEHLEPDSRLRQADQHVHTNVSNLRHVLGRAAQLRRNAHVIKADGRYRLDPATVDVDLWQLNDLLTRAATADGPDREGLLRQACAQYTGPLAADCTYDWIGPHRETARRTAVEAHRQLAELLLPTQPRAAADVLDTAVTIDPYDEDLYRLALHARHRCGDHGGVRRLHRALTAALADLDIEPSEETTRLVEQLLHDATRPDLASTGDDQR